MPIGEALFWAGITVVGTGLFIIWERHLKSWWWSIPLVGAGVLAIVYSVYSHAHPEAQLPTPPSWVYLLLLTWCALGYVVYDRRRGTARAVPADPKKLTIHSAVYGLETVEDIDVTNKLRDAIGDALAIRVDNNLVPRDPATMLNKRLEVEYSYGSAVRKKISRPEYELLVLPVDTWMEKEITKLTPPAQANSQKPPNSNEPILVFEYDRVNRGDWAQGVLSEPQILYIKNAQLGTPNTAWNVTARVKFIHSDGSLFTDTRATWFYSKTKDGVTHSSRPPHVDLEQGDIQSFALLIKHPDGTLWAHEQLMGMPIGTCKLGKWKVTVTVVSDNTEPLVGNLELTVYPDKHFEWSRLTL